MLQSDIRKPSRLITKGEIDLISRFNILTPLAIAVLFLTYAVGAQQPATQKPAEKKAEEKATESAKKKTEKSVPPPVITTKETSKTATAEQVAESSILVYGGLIGGRQTLNQIRKTAFEKGKISVTNAEGKTEQATYQRWTQRAETLAKEKIRLELDFPNARYSLIFNAEKIFGIHEDQTFTPREDAARSFENNIIHGLEALLRYKENESKIELSPKEKMLGVEYYLLDVTDTQARKTRFYISTKTFRVMMLDYQEDGRKFRRRFYDYNYAQGTLVPYLTILWADEKIIEQSEVGSITFGQKIDDAIFNAG